MRIDSQLAHDGMPVPVYVFSVVIYFLLVAQIMLGRSHIYQVRLAGDLSHSFFLHVRTNRLLAKI